MECLCPPPHPPLAFETLHPVYFPELSFLLSDSPQFLPLFPFFTACPRPVSPLPFPPPTPTPVIRSRGFHMKMTYLTGHISMCHSASDATLQIFWRGSAPILLFFFSFFFTLTAPPPPLQHHTLLHSCPK